MRFATTFILLFSSLSLVDPRFQECITERMHNSLVRNMTCFIELHANTYKESLKDFAPKKPEDDSVCNVHMCNATSHHLKQENPIQYKGHLEFFGQQGQQRTEIDTIEGCLEGPEFLRKYVYKHKPVLMKGCANAISATNLWSDEYFLSRKDMREWMPIVETQKTIHRNDRGPHIFNMTFQEFISRYTTDPFYVINGVSPDFLRKDVNLPPPLRCSRTLRQMDDVHLWFSSGGTESSQHFDTHDNLLTMISGSKQVLLTDPIHSLGLYMDYHDKYGLSPINVRHIDLSVYPKVQSIPIIEVNITKGDMLYIPTHWWHQVNSFKNDTRNIALSIGWNGFFRVGEVDERFGYLKEGLSVIRGIPKSDAIFGLELIEWSKSIRRLKGVDKLSDDDLCGAYLPEDTTLSEIPLFDDDYWWAYGIGYLNIGSTRSFFEDFLQPMAMTVQNARQSGVDIKMFPSMCSLRIVFVLESIAYVLDMRKESPNPIFTSKELHDDGLLDSDIYIFINE
ncbi:hypothetical protein AAMO2058_000891300 [Amorphochlora amoebiformis]